MALPPKIFDRALIARHLERRPPGYDDFVTRLVVADLMDRLSTISRTFARALILGPDPAALPTTGRSGDAPIAFERAGTVIGELDPEMLTLPRTDYDLIVSVLDLNVVNDVPGFLIRIREHLIADGLFIGVALGGDTLTELRHAFLAADAQLSGGAFARVAPFIPVPDVGGLLQRAGFALPVSDVETHLVRYADPLRLMREIKALGGSNPLASRPTRFATRRLVAEASLGYAAAHADPDGRIRATLELIWLSGWAPHEGQQQPLKPGSATISLARVLKPKA
jgi:SAM-dependent methyltransferase